MGDLDALLVTSPPSVRWLTGLAASRVAVLLRRGGGEGDVLATDGRYAEEAAQTLDVPVVADRTDAWLAERVDAGERLGIEDHIVTWARVRALGSRLPEVALVPAGALVEAQRRRKDPGEVDLLARACRITAEALEETFAQLAPGVTEREVARAVEGLLRDGGADDRAFETIVASGANGSRPHHRPGSRRLEAGDLVTIDAGALVGGYHADMTRTVALGDPGPRLEEVYRAVQRAQKAGVDALTAGVSAGEVDRTTRDILVDAGLGDAIAHPTGHGVGLEIHEQPILREGEVATLLDGAVVTVEPGAYLPGLGGVRIEDTVAVTEQGPRVLTRTPTDLRVL